MILALLIGFIYGKVCASSLRLHPTSGHRPLENFCGYLDPEIGGRLLLIIECEPIASKKPD
jgi:hypothetical protein